jgi:ubiquinone/menaquinone biosynthesis C-methylase UbiE
MKKDHTKDYDQWAKEHDIKTLSYDDISRNAFYDQIDFKTKNMKLLDIACGPGHDLRFYRDTMGCDVYGVDSSEKEVTNAQKKIGKDNVRLGTADNLPFPDNNFDIVFCKYAPQAFEDIKLFYKEVLRVLKKGGIFMFLSTHPMRHFLEKQNKPRDYFKKEVVTSWIYEHTLPLKEYSHTLSDYLNPLYLENFQINHFKEYQDSPLAIDKIDNETYPGFFIIKSVKK